MPRRRGKLTVFGSVSPDTAALLAILAAVLLANLPYLSGLFDPSPLDFRGGLTSALTPGWLPGKPTIDPSNGFTSQAIGHLAALGILHLHLPWWNPYEGTGMPLVGETQAAGLFPPTLLTLISNGQLYEHMLLEFVAGSCTYLLLRRLGLRRAAALAGGIAFALNGKFAWFSDATVNPLPFLPMLLLGIERAYVAARAGRPGGWRLIGLAGALSVYAGFPEVAYIDTLVGVCWLAWRAGCLERPPLRRLLAKAALGGAAGTLLAAPMLVAMTTYLNHADLVVHAGTQLGRRHLPSSAMAQLLMPYIYGQISSEPLSPIWIKVGGYLSATLLVLAVVGVLAPRRRGLKLVLVGWSLLVFARLYGQPPLLGHVIGVLPAMSRIQFYRYGTAALELPVIVLAALGVDDLASDGANRRRLVACALAVTTAVATAAFLARPVVHALGTRLHHGAFFHASIIWAAVTGGAVASVALISSPRVRAALLALVVAIDAVALFAVPEFAAPRMASVDFAGVAYLRQHLGLGRFYTLGPIAPDYGSYFRLASLGVDDFPPKAYARYIHSRVDPKAPFVGFRPLKPSPQTELLRHLDGLRFAGVRYVVSPRHQSLPRTSSTLRLVFRSSTTNVYRLVGARPYFEAPGCGVIPSGRESVRVTCSRPTTLVRRETWLPGWSARIDGRPATIREAARLFQAVTVPAGSHRVTFAFAPPGMGWALLGFVAGCALLLGSTLRPSSVIARASSRWRGTSTPLGRRSAHRSAE